MSTTNDTKHIDNIAVDEFNKAMKQKLYRKRQQGYGGWQEPHQCTNTKLRNMLIEHINKGDMVDIGNIAMMLWYRTSILLIKDCP